MFQGKVALITGGSSGIGRATALAFARAGAKVIIAARGAERGQQVVEEIRQLGGEGLFLRTDVSNSLDLENLVSSTVSRYGRLDIAFNNAATVGEFGMTADLDEEEFDRATTYNLKSVWLCMKHEIRAMLRQAPAGGAIVNTSSINGFGGVPRSAFYAMAKAGVLALTKSAALEYASQGIRINALVAGPFRTPMLEGVMDTMAGADPKMRQAVESRYQEMIPAGRIGIPEEAAQTVLWLCSDAASYVTGHSMVVDGGVTAPYR
jgi:NAD(P)-dependent dehydrogenase (short-subunit alcohol dehydrogenase family)